MRELQDLLQLDSQLSELSRVQPWIEAAADRMGVPEETRYAMHLCMEEALANVILHGYGSEPGHPIVIRTDVSAGALYITIDDQAPPFSPVAPPLPAQNGEVKLASLAALPVGGNGIRLMRRFAGSLKYERVDEGNRLTLGFPIPSNNSSS